MRQRLPIAGAFLPVLISACLDQPSTAPVSASIPDVRHLVVGNAAVSLADDGRFVLLPPSLGVRTITPERASTLAVSAVRSFAPFHRRRLERILGAPIDFNSLQPDARVYFAESPYDQDDIPPDAHPAVRKHLGPFYLVRMLSGDTQFLSVAVSAYNTDVDIRDDGSILFAAQHGDDFIMTAVSGRDMIPIPISPEHAVHIAAAALAVRVAEVPRLILPPADKAPQSARWQVTLEKPAVVRGGLTGRSYFAGEVYVGLRGDLAVPLEVQPSSLRHPGPLPGGHVSVRRRPTIPFNFEPIAR